MGADDVSAWWIALIGTLAGVVGAVAAVLQVTQRHIHKDPSNLPDIPPHTPTVRKLGRGTSALDAFAGVDNDVMGLFRMALWTVFFELIAWIVMVALEVPPQADIGILIFALPLVFAAIGLFTTILYLVIYSVGGKLSIEALFFAMTIIINVAVIVITIKIVT
jgi:hypothetical protein